jgi:hypothetical protein
MLAQRLTSTVIMKRLSVSGKANNKTARHVFASQLSVELAPSRLPVPRAKCISDKRWISPKGLITVFSVDYAAISCCA